MSSFERRQVTIPGLVRIKPGALDRTGLYATRMGWSRALILHSSDLLPSLGARLASALAAARIDVLATLPVSEASFEKAEGIFRELPAGADCVIGLGGGKALDVAKYVGFLAHLPYLAVPTSLSNDGFCSPQSSLTIGGRRRSLPAAMPHGVVVDTEVCLAAPPLLWLSGVGDLVSKLTAVPDWKLACRADGTQVDDFAALLSDATVFQFIARPERDETGTRLLATALMLNGVAMAICGSSRPASGGEHLLSHALDSFSARPRLHGLQVGVATYLVSLLQQGRNTRDIDGLLARTGFWEAIAADPFPLAEWIEAVHRAPSVKRGFTTILSSEEMRSRAIALLQEDPRLRACLRA